MDDAALADIYNFRRLNERLATSGQPSEEELQAAAHAGFEVVVNLGLTGTEYALPDESGLAESLGLEYTHIPVIWERPTPADLERFFAVMEANAARRVYVHCAANKRVSVFVCLYRVLHLGWDLERAMADVHAIWEPDETWSRFLHETLARDGPARHG